MKKLYLLGKKKFENCKKHKIKLTGCVIGKGKTYESYGCFNCGYREYREVK